MYQTPGTPNLADFTTFVFSSMGVPASALSASSPLLQNVLNRALELTPTYARAPDIYTDAVYNCAGHLLVEIAQDQIATVTASFLDNTMTVTAIAAGTIVPGMQIVGVTADDPPPVVQSYGTGTGGLGDYAVTLGASISSVSFTLRGAFWARLRGPQGYKLSSFAPGVVQSTSDETTSVAFMVSDAFKNLTLYDLQFMNTPWGRAFLGYCQNFSPIWGLT